MCQMCEEYEAELARLGLVEEARKVREQRHGTDERDAPAKRTEPAADADGRR